jgi:hypothetical protein
MAFRVRYLIGQHETGGERVATLEVAKAIVEIAVNSGRVESADVRDSNGELVFRLARRRGASRP